MIAAYSTLSLSFSRIAGTLVAFLFLFLSTLSASAQSNTFGWAHRYSSSGHDQGRSIQADNAGCTYLAGSFQDSLAFDSTAIVLHSQGGTDALLAKFNPSGRALWAVSIGSTGDELGIRVSLDKLGYLYLTGSFTSQSLSLGSFTLTNSDTTGTDIFLAKFDTTGTLLWAKSMGAAGADMPTALGADGFGNSYLSGYFSAPALTIDTTTLASGGGEDFFLAKHNPAGNLLWAVRSGSPLHDRSSALAVDSLGHCVLTGFFTGDTIFFASDTLVHTASSANPDIFLLKYNPQGIEEWGRSAGTDSTDLSTGLFLDADGFIYLAGSTLGSELRFDSVKVINTASQALFLVRLNPAGDPDWETSAAVTGSASGWELTADLFGFMYLMTDFSGQLQVDNTTYHDSTGSRLVFASYSIFRDFEWSKEATGTGTARGFSISSDDLGNSFATGSFSDSLYFGTTGLAMIADTLGLNQEDLFITQLNGSQSGGGNTGGGSGAGSGVCHMIREVIESCGAPGDEVLIRGIFRGKPSAVSFGGIPAQIVRRTYISVTAIVPAGYMAGPVAVTVNSCTDTAAFGLKPTVSATASAQGLCAGTPLTLTATGADFYNWSSGQAGSVITVSPAVPTAYIVTGTIGACDAKATVVVEVDTALAGFTVLAPVQPVCAGSTITLQAQGAGSYSWSNGNLTDMLVITPTANQTFTIIGTAGACTDTTTVAITVVPMPVVTVSPASAAICPGDSITLTASGAATYSWWGAGADTSLTVSPASSTVYTVTGTTGGCSVTATASVQVHPQPQLLVISGSSTLCEGETLYLTASGGAAAYSWSGPGGFSSNQPGISVPNATAAHSGIYSVQAVGGACPNPVATMQVQVNPVPQLTVTPQVQTIFPGTQINITATGAATYVWQPGSDTTSVLSAAPLATTQYQVTGTTAGCSATGTATVIVTPLSVTAGPNQELCGQTSTTLSATISPAGISGSWSVLSGIGGSFSDASSPLAVFTGQAGQHYLLQWQANGATSPAATSTVQVSFGIMPDLPVVEPVSVCANSSATLFASGNASDFAWYRHLSQQPVGSGFSYTTPALTSGTVYYVIARNGACETAPVTVPVGLYPSPAVVAGPDATIVSGKRVQLHARGAATYSWSPAQGLSNPQVSNPVASPATTTTYTVTGTSEMGCSATAMLTITVLPLIQPTNIFTPNGDGLNDRWDISALTEGYPNCRVEVFTRWGQRVFSSTGYRSPWDGKSDGKDLPEGTYFYTIEPGEGHEAIRGMVVLGR